MLGIGEGELFLIVLFAFIIFGPDKLPGMGRTIGRAIRQFRDAQQGFTEVVQTNIVDPATEAISDTPKRPNRNRAAELDEDADIDLPEGEEGSRPKRTETFAERKKRLAAEKAAREAEEREAQERAAEAEKDIEAGGGVAETDADSDADAPAAEADAAEKDAEPAAAEKSEPAGKPATAEKHRPSAADLYSMKRPAKTEDEPAEKADVPEVAETTATSEAAPADGAEPAAAAPEPEAAPAPTTDETKEA